MIVVRAGMTIPNNYPYKGFVVTKVARNGWCRGYYPNNVRNDDVDAAMTSVRAHWLVGVDADYEIFA